jgi:solute carrier family 25 (mitochondrial oxoglutarate transporter), member 11
MAAAAVQPFVCGGMAACFASSCIHPIDLAKVRIQLMSTLRPDAPKIGFPNLITTMVRQEGLLRCVHQDPVTLAAS